MNCQKCGNPIKEGSQFCTNCGAKVNDAPTGEMNNQAGATPFPMPNNNPAPMPTPQPAPTPGPAPMNNTPSYPTMNNNSSSNNGILYAIIGILVIALIGVAVFFIFFKKDNSSSSSTSNGGTVAQSTYAVSYSGFTFNVPTDLKAQATSEALIITNSTETAAAMIKNIGQGNYSLLVANKASIPAVYQQQGGIVKNVEEKTYSGKSYLQFELTVNGETGLVAYAENSSNIFVIAIQNTSNTLDTEFLKEIAPVINNATYGQSTTSITTSGFNIDPTPILELAK